MSLKKLSSSRAAKLDRLKARYHDKVFLTRGSDEQKARAEGMLILSFLRHVLI